LLLQDNQILTHYWALVKSLYEINMDSPIEQERKAWQALEAKMGVIIALMESKDKVNPSRLDKETEALSKAIFAYREAREKRKSADS